MKVGIIGTRGIPNQYGGFEQFAMFFAQYLVEEGIEVTVYNSSNHPYKESEWKGVQLKHIYDPEDKIGTVGQFVYDLLSILDARKQGFDVIFQLGYTSSSVWGFLFPKKVKLITNMDGLEWKRTKYNKYVQAYLKKAEAWAVKQSDELIADSVGIQAYLARKYKVSSTYIPYGATLFTEADSSYLRRFDLRPFEYDLVIARLEPENNVELIIQGHVKTKDVPLYIVGNHKTAYGSYLHKKYGNAVHFLGTIYDLNILNNLRFYTRLYFHGHSVGGTNPSLLEAMACGCMIVAHQNEFNKAVLNEDAFYFSSPDDVTDLLKSLPSEEVKEKKVERNKAKIQTTFSFKSVHEKLMELIEKTS